MTFQLRDYQHDIVRETREALRVHNSVLIHLPTGGGKTALASYMTGGAMNKGLRAWFICHRDFLLEQTSATYEKVEIDHAFIAAGYPQNVFHPIQICSVGSLARRVDMLEPPHLCIWDECHHLAAGSWKKIKEWAGRAKHIGLSATPCRLDGKGLDQFFDHMVHGPEMSWLIEHGYLSKYRLFAPSKPNLSGVHTVAGDFNKGELDQVMNDGEIVGDMVRHYRDKASGKKAVYFATSVEHSKRIAATFSASGIPAIHLDGTNSTKERRDAARLFADGTIKIISNVDLFGEGYDLAAQAGRDVTIEAVGLARPTKSLALFLQQIGRALRPKDEPAIILDHAGNLARHGLPDEERVWSLKGVMKEKRGGAGMPIKTCPQCFFTHAPRPTCPECGHVYEIEARAVEEVDADLKEVDAEEIKRSRKAEQEACKTLEDLIDLAERRGYKNPEKWAAHIWTYKQMKGGARANAQWEAYGRD